MRKSGALGLVVVLATACAAAPPVDRESASPIAIATTAATDVPAPTALGTASPAPTATPEPPPRIIRVIADIEFAIVTGSADLRVETAISREDEAAIAAAVAADVDAVQRDFDRRFGSPPAIYVFATNESYALGLRRVVAYPAATATFVAENSVSFFEPALLTILVNWQAIGDRRPISAIRHELTHRMTLEACAPRCDLVPAWLNEGEARLAEALVPGGDWRLMRVRYEAASMAATETLIPLNSLVSQLAWNALSDWAGYYKYQEAARATELLRADIGGPAPIARLYERIRRGENLARAYTALTGRPFDEFVASLSLRMREGMPAPGLVIVPTAPEAQASSYLLFGFAPSSTVTVTLTGPRVSETWPQVVSPFGAVFDGLGPEQARGSYTLSVQQAGSVLTAKLTKATAGVRGDPR